MSRNKADHKELMLVKDLSRYSDKVPITVEAEGETFTYHEGKLVAYTYDKFSSSEEKELVNREIKLFFGGDW